MSRNRKKFYRQKIDTAVWKCYCLRRAETTVIAAVWSSIRYNNVEASGSRLSLLSATRVLRLSQFHGLEPAMTWRPVITDAKQHIFHNLLVSSCFFTCTKLYCLVTETRGCEQLAQDCYAAVPDRESNPRLIDWVWLNVPPNTLQTKPRFGRLLRPPAWKWSGTFLSILVEREGMDNRRK